MVKFIFTVDYEIYGNGQGSILDLVYKPAGKLKSIFDKWNARFVTFVEVAEMEVIESIGTDDSIQLIHRQLQDFYMRGYELGLHIHPWWYNARHEDGRWLLDLSEYNLCTLRKERIINIVDRALNHLRILLGITDFMPISFRAGHLLFQPTRALAKILADRGIKIDSSVYKGGLWRKHDLDYRPAISNGYYWKFSDNVTVPDSRGRLLELPIHTQMVPVWKAFTSRRVALQKRNSSSAQTGKKILSRLMDFLHFRYPLKLDLGQMTIEEVIRAVDRVIREDLKDPTSFRPIVAITHTKDPIDYENVDYLLSYMERNHIGISTFSDIYRRIQVLSE